MKTVLFSTGCAESRIKVSVLAFLRCHSRSILAVSTYLGMHKNPAICTYKLGHLTFVPKKAAKIVKTISTSHTDSNYIKPLKKYSPRDTNLFKLKHPLHGCVLGSRENEWTSIHEN
jgi:hypothetical protein